ncbi:hypothetical protein BKA70DRAFT_651787 [Coprinopsis sp. MPI-PUGE-AT-0042]|nr:hypothetical protein BKA70DRAFT_651787 [Coprinopsis sp. MPI-PUGE-AT-0042]
MRFNILFLLTCCAAFASAFFTLPSSGDGVKCIPHHRVQAGQDWAKKFYAAADARSAEFLNKLIGESTVIFFGSNPPTRGREAIRRSINWQWSATTSIPHTLEDIVVLEDRTLVQMSVAYNYTDGVSLTAGAYVVLVKAPEDPSPLEIRIYGDFAAVFAKFIDIAGPPPSA